MSIPLKLYGGDITASVPEEIAYSLTDASNFREIPDTQEAFIVSNASTSAKYEKSLIFDLLEYVDNEDYNQAIATHIEDLVDTDESVSNHFIEQVKDADGQQVYISLIEYKNKRRDAKDDDSPTNYITYVSLIRMKKVGTDALITLNIPLASEIEISGLLNSLKSNQSSSDQTIVSLRQTYDWFNELSHTYQVLDGSLFG
ncbi:hypothetical protein DFJ63DRAFT_320873 [Scheffersomyces coipomensis]|uniref:uncharacterized protein n=1 Tax=Scheffersomyces coipomensis TaxID=1788519 RepID=UPI00315D03BD